MKYAMMIFGLLLTGTMMGQHESVSQDTMELELESVLLTARSPAADVCISKTEGTISTETGCGMRCRTLMESNENFYHPINDWIFMRNSEVYFEGW